MRARGACPSEASEDSEDAGMSPCQLHQQAGLEVGQREGSGPRLTAAQGEERDGSVEEG